MAANNNDEEWFAVLSEVGDDKFIIQNIEDRIFSNATNKSIWLIYLKFLKEKNYREVSTLFSVVELYAHVKRFGVSSARVGPNFRSWDKGGRN